MAIGTGQQIGASVTSARLGALLENLVAVQEELEPISTASRKGCRSRLHPEPLRTPATPCSPQSPTHATLFIRSEG
jgi:hypothetical protein